MVYFPTSPKQCSALPCETVKHRTAHLRIGCVTQSNSCSVKQLISFLQSYGLSTVCTSIPLITRFVGSCSSVCTRCRATMSTNSISDWLTFGAVYSKCCWRCCQRVHEKASAGACSREGRTLPTSAVGCFHNGIKLSIDCSLCTTCFWSFQ